jgi:MFS family permease
MIGYTTSFIGTTVALGSFGDAFGFQNMSTAESTLIKANVVSLFQAGAFFGSPVAYATCHYLGRVKSLWITATVFLVGAAITFGSITGSIGPLYAGRVICGLGVGGCTMVVSTSLMVFTAFDICWCSDTNPPDPCLHCGDRTSSYPWSSRWYL